MVGATAPIAGAETGVEFAPSLTDAEVQALLAPYLQREFSVSSAEWRAIKGRVWRNEWAGMMRSFARRLYGQEKSVPEQYENWYDQFDYDVFWPNPDGKRIPCVWRDRGMLLARMAIRRPQLLMLLRVLQQIAPERVCEIGCGSGVNLFVLSACLPHLQLSGLEYSSNGVDKLRRCLQMPEIPAVVAAMAPMPVKSTTAHTGIDPHHGSAEAMPFADKSFDVCYTNSALEAMESIRDKALRELARVARRYVIMIEPFRDVNESGARRFKVMRKRFFEARFSDLESAGLRPVFVYTDFPARLNLANALVVAEPI